MSQSNAVLEGDISRLETFQRLSTTTPVLNGMRFLTAAPSALELAPLRLWRQQGGLLMEFKNYPQIHQSSNLVDRPTIRPPTMQVRAASAAPCRSPGAVLPLL